MTDNHKKFLDHLDESIVGVERAARWLRGHGHTLRVGETTKAETHADYKGHQDDGDLFIEDRIEVKRFGKNWTCREDWPYGRRTIVCAKHSYDRAEQTPYLYIMLSNDMTHAITVLVKATRDQWYVKKVKDRGFNRVQDCYHCPLKLVTFHRLEDEED